MTSSNWDEFNTPDSDPAPDEDLIAEIERNMRKTKQNTEHATGTEKPEEPQYPLLVVRRREKTPEIPRVPGRGILSVSDCPTPYHHLAMLDAEPPRPRVWSKSRGNSSTRTSSPSSTERSAACQ